MDKDKEKPISQPSQTLSGSETPFDDGLKQGMKDPNEERKERLKQKIRNHAKANRKMLKVKAKRGPNYE